MRRLVVSSKVNPVRVAVSALALFLCVFAIFLFLVILKNASVYTQFFYIPIILFSFWWRRKGIILTSAIVVTLLFCNLIFASSISIVDNLVRSAMFLFVSVLTSVIFEQRKKKEEELNSLKEFNENIVNSISESLLVINPQDYRILAANDEASREMKRTKEDLIGKTCYEATHNSLTPCTSPHQCPLKEVLKNKKPVRVEHVHYDKDQNKINLEIVAYPIEDNEGKISQVIHMATDITERKKAEEALQLSEQRYRELADSLPEIIFEIDTKANLVYANSKAYKLTGYSKDDLSHGFNVLDLILPEEKETAKENIGKVFSGTMEHPNEYTFIRKDGTHFPVTLSSAPIIKDGKVVGARGVIIDITERKKTEDRLKISSEIFELATDSILVHDMEGQIIYFNEAACRQTGYSKEELAKINLHSLDAPETASLIEPRIKELFEKGSAVFESVQLTKDKTRIPVEIHSRIIESGGKKLVLAVVRDITERKKAAEALSNSEAKYRALVEYADDSIMLTDLRGKNIYRNPAYFKNLGLEENNEGESDSFAKMHPDDLPVVKEKMAELLKTGFSTTEYRVKHRDGSWVYRLARSSMIFNQSHEPYAILAIIRDVTEQKIAEEKLKESEEKYQTIYKSSKDALMLLDERGFFDCNESSLQLFGCKSTEEFAKNSPADLSPLTQPDGTLSVESAQKHIHKALDAGKDQFFWVHQRTDGTTFFADVLLTKMQFKGKSVLQATVRDITEQKEAEQKLKENQARIAAINEKLRVVGGLTRHDVRNKLYVITGNAYLLKKKYADKPDIVDGLSKMEQSVKESGRIFDYAKMYEELGAQELVYVNVEKALNEATVLFSGSLPMIINKCQGLTVLADSFLRQLFYNFIDNTRKYGQKTTAISVHYEKEGEDQLKLIYEDDGAGISAENKLKLFSQGFSTGGSTGFGLFLSKKMIEVYGWEIQETGELGMGVRFVITIPKKNKKGQDNYQIQA